MMILCLVHELESALQNNGLIDVTNRIEVQDDSIEIDINDCTF